MKLLIVLLGVHFIEGMDFTDFYRIVGGYPIEIEEAPYQAIFQIDGQMVCGAVIVDKNCVLTAAHCITVPTQNISIRVGTKLRNIGGSIHRAVKTVVHEWFVTKPIEIFDIAIVFVSPHFVYSPQVARIQLAMVAPTPGVVAVVTGFGATFSAGSASDKLRIAEMVVMDVGACNASYGGRLNYAHLCAGLPRGGRDACKGDSGGPLVVHGVLVGLTSTGRACARAGFPGVYASIPALLVWVRRQHAHFNGRVGETAYYIHSAPNPLSAQDSDESFQESSEEDVIHYFPKP